MDKTSSGGVLRQTELGSSYHICILYDLPRAGAIAQPATVEVWLLQEAANTHPFPADSCELVY